MTYSQAFGKQKNNKEKTLMTHRYVAEIRENKNEEEKETQK